jgi:hypothetical protein
MSKTGFITLDGELQISRLSIRNKVELKLFGRSKLGKHALNQSWRGAAEFYAFKCERHGIVVNYLHGYEQVLKCPICLKARYLREAPRKLSA